MWILSILSSISKLTYLLQTTTYDRDLFKLEKLPELRKMTEDLGPQAPSQFEVDKLIVFDRI